jgi:subtilisin family serine protease
MQGGNRRAGRWLDGLPGRGVLATAIVAAAVAVLPARAHGAPEPLDPSAPVTLVAVERRADGSLDVDRYRADDLEQAAAIDTVLRSHDETLSVGVDVPVTLQATADPMSADQWALTATTFTSAWSATQGGSVKVAVIDTGVRGDHEDLQGAVLSGRDYVQPGGDGRVDPGGHGTHVAGIVAARVNNGRGIAGAAPKARILPVRVLDGNGAGHASNVVDGIIWAADQGAKVINLSLGTGSPFEPFRTAIQYARSKGAVVVVAAGNSALTGNQPVYPAAYPEAIAVGAVDRQLRRAPYSNYGSYVDLAAPGDAIVSTYGSGSKAYAWASGTSMATPYGRGQAPRLQRRAAARRGRGQRA